MSDCVAQWALGCIPWEALHCSSHSYPQTPLQAILARAYPRVSGLVLLLQRSRITSLVIALG